MCARVPAASSGHRRAGRPLRSSSTAYIRPSDPSVALSATQRPTVFRTPSPLSHLAESHSNAAEEPSAESESEEEGEGEEREREREREKEGGREEEGDRFPIAITPSLPLRAVFFLFQRQPLLCTRLARIGQVPQTGYSFDLIISFALHSALADPAFLGRISSTHWFKHALLQNTVLRNPASEMRKILCARSLRRLLSRLSPAPNDMP